MRKQWYKLSDEERKEAIVDMAMELDDFNRLRDDTLRRIYNDLYEIDDINLLEYTADINNWVEEQQELPPLTEKQLISLHNHLDTNYDANMSIWDNIENSYLYMKGLENE